MSKVRLAQRRASCGARAVEVEQRQAADRADADALAGDVGDAREP